MFGSGSEMVDEDLPAGYKRLLDLSTSGNLRYVSNIFLTGADTLAFTYMSESGNLLGSFNATNANDNYSYYPSTNALAKYARYNGQMGGSSSAPYTEYSIVISPNGITGSRNPSEFNPTEFVCSTPFCVFATSDDGSVISSATIYGNIEISGSQRISLIPCENPSGVLGWYDTLHGEFVEPKGEGVPSTSGYDTSHLVPKGDDN